MTAAERQRARRAEYLEETGRGEPSPDRRLSNFMGPEHPERQRRALHLVLELEARAFGRELGPASETAWDRELAAERAATRARASAGGRKRWALAKGARA